MGNNTSRQEHLNTIPSTGQFHSSHPKHKLELVNREKYYKCNGCKERGLLKHPTQNQLAMSGEALHVYKATTIFQFSRCGIILLHGFGKRYRCERCKFDLHEACMFPKSPTSHDFFRKRSFKFFDHPQGKGERYCDACGRDIKGFVYHCKDAGLDMHPCCLNLSRVIKAGEMEFQICEKENAPSRCCSYCKKKVGKDGKGWSYMSTCKNYYIHMSCVTERVAENSTKEDYFRAGNGDKDQKCVTLENRKLTLDKSSKGGKKSICSMIVEIVLNTIISILFGNPIDQVLDFALNL